MIRLVDAPLANVRVIDFSDLVVDCAARVGAQVMIRGLRAVSDFEFEFQMALMNRRLASRPRDRVPDAEPGVHLPELDAGQGSRAARRPRPRPGAAAGREAAQTRACALPPRAAAAAAAKPTSAKRTSAPARMSGILERWQEQRAPLAPAPGAGRGGRRARRGRGRTLAREGVARVSLVDARGRWPRRAARRRRCREAGVTLVARRRPPTRYRATAAALDRSARRSARRGRRERAVARSAVPGRRRGCARAAPTAWSRARARTTADVLRAALWLIGLAPGVTRCPRSSSWCCRRAAASASAVLVFADCGVVPDPDARAARRDRHPGGRPLRAAHRRDARASRSCRSRRAVRPSTRASTRCAKR